VVNKGSGTYLAGEIAGGTVLTALTTAETAVGAAAFGGKYGSLFGRGGEAFLNSGAVRFGWYWTGSADAIGLRVLEGAATTHIPFYVFP
jgi:hypothetical protein